MNTRKSRDVNLQLLTRLYFRLLPILILLAMVKSVNGVISGLFGSNFVGADAMSAIGLYGPFTMFFSAVSFLFVCGSQILCGKFMGKNEIEKTRVIFSMDLLAVTVFSCLSIIVLGVGAFTGLTRILAADPVTRETLNKYIFGQMIGLLPALLGQQLSAFLSLENQTKRATIASLVCVAGFSALLVPFMKMNGVYTANILNGAVCALVVVLYSWIVRKSFPKNMEQLMVIPDDFGVSESERIDISIREIQEVVNVSEQVIKFCRDLGIDDRRGYLAGLCLEEMAGNVVDHGFRKDNKEHSVDIRVVHKGDDVILRIRDDCIPFDPAARLEIIDPVDKMKNVGIRLVYQIAKDVSYQNILGLNVLTIRI